MKRFLLFAGHYYYPSGGWNDFAGFFDTPEEAQEAAERKKGDWDWWHVIDATLPFDENKWVTENEFGMSVVSGGGYLS